MEAVVVMTVAGLETTGAKARATTARGAGVAMSFEGRKKLKT